MSEAALQSPERADLKTRFSADRQPEKHGRPTKFKDRLTRDFLEALSNDFAEHGLATLQRVREEEPAQYLKIAASVVPKEIAITPRLSGVDDDKLAAAIELVLAMRRPEDAKAITAEVLLND